MTCQDTLYMPNLCLFLRQDLIYLDIYGNFIESVAIKSVSYTHLTLPTICSV